VPPPPNLPQAVPIGEIMSEPTHEWEIAMVGSAVANALAAADVPAPPAECQGEYGLAAGMGLLNARKQLEADPSAALASIGQALERCPSWAAAHNVRGNVLQRLDQLKEAVAAYREALRLVPDYDAPRFNLGVVQLRRKDPAAIDTFSELIALKPSYPDVYASRAQAYLFAKRYKEGLADLEQAVQQDASSRTVWLMLAQVRERLKDARANEAYCKALDLGEESAEDHCKR
jgi:Tfp pilus assembly protein PilF